MGIGLSILLLAAGAILAFAVRAATILGMDVSTVGYILMAGGGSGDPNVFDEKEIFSHRRITVAPIVCLIGYLFVVYAIMKKPE